MYLQAPSEDSDGKRGMFVEWTPESIDRGRIKTIQYQIGLHKVTALDRGVSLRLKQQASCSLLNGKRGMLIFCI